MPVSLSRRSLLGLFGSGIISGCVGDPSKNSSSVQTDGINASSKNEEQGDDIPEECDFPSQSLQGRADPIETTVEIERPADLRAECATIAAESALDQMQERLDLELTSQSYWISAGRQLVGDRYIAEIRVHAEKRTRDGNTSYHLCPDPKFNFDGAIETTPREVTTTILIEDEDDKNECATEVRLTQEQRHIDSM